MWRTAALVCRETCGLADELSASGSHSASPGDGHRRLSPHDATTLAWLLLPIAVLYVSTASPYVLGDDSGEFSTLYAAGGVAHPSGYPLYALVLRAFSWLPVVTPASELVINLSTAVTLGFNPLPSALLDNVNGIVVTS